MTGNAKPQGVNLDAVGILPIAGNFSALGRVGAQNAEANDSYAATGGVAVLNPNPGKRATNYKLAVGLQYDLTRSLGLRGEMERYRINNAASNHSDIDVYSVGLVVKFH